MLVKEGFRIVVESGAGASASFTDAAYDDAGATVVEGVEAWKSDIVVKVWLCRCHSFFGVYVCVCVCLCVYIGVILLQAIENDISW